MKSFLARWMWVVLWMGVIFLVSAQSNPYQTLPADWTNRCAQIIPWENLSKVICQNDIIGILSHILEYVVLGFLFVRAYHPTRVRAGSEVSKNLTYAFISAALFALGDEIHQIFVPERTFQVFDLSLDVSGAVLGVLLFWLIKRRNPISEITIIEQK